jgi:hypothetical protein
MYRSTFSWPRHWLEVSGQLHAPAALRPGKEPPGTHCIGGWVDPRPVLDQVEERKFLTLRDSNADLSVVQPVASRYTNYDISPTEYIVGMQNNIQKIRISYVKIEKVKLSLRHEGVWGVGLQIHIFLTSALVGGEWPASRPGRFNPGERTPGTHWIWGWVDPRTGLDDVEKRKFLTLPGLELRPLGRPARSQSLYWLRYPGSKDRKSSGHK